MGSWYGSPCISILLGVNQRSPNIEEPVPVAPLPWLNATGGEVKSVRAKLSVLDITKLLLNSALPPMPNVFLLSVFPGVNPLSSKWP